ncbi:SGNH/GDSL hydrolase family protein [Hydrogenophaga sp. 5NK40-0174]|uniref:SGNH/GDSL hydrolase family protein n=1 Tax=Hydrogenophaga sp. 5NK40-0174 TaxID=3127649 RepID=UPI00310A67BC
MRLRNIATPIALACLLAACGGGGGDDESSSGSVASSSKVSSCGTTDGPLRIMPLGDSITEGEAGHNSYRRSFFKNLVAAGCNVDLVGSKTGVSRLGKRNSGSASAPNADFDQNHEGYWDYNTQEVTGLAASRVAAARPDIVLIHLGSNDIIRGQDAGSAASEIGALIDTIRSANPDVHIVLAKIIPNSKSNVTAFNNALDGVASSRQQSRSPIVVVNQAAGYSVGDNYDGVHPNPLGETKIANKFSNAVLSWRE